MAKLPTILNPKAYWRLAERRLRPHLRERRLRLDPNFRGVSTFPPGHFHSPLLDLQSIKPDAAGMLFDGPEYWEHIELRPRDQRAYYEDLVENFPVLGFPKTKCDGYRYFWQNDFFPLSDAFTLSGIIRKEKPQKIIEVGSGFSSAVMLDTLAHADAAPDLTFVEPFPDRLRLLLSSDELSRTRLLAQLVQTVPLSVFEELDVQDILFVDSSHVAKVGSDLTFILLRILPRLRPGVLVHFHDIFYPFSYPVAWIREGRAWNESVFLRAFLAGNPSFEVVAFNSFAGYTFPDIFHGRLDKFLENTGGSIWIRKRV